MLLAVTTTGKIVLAVAAGLLILFAIASSFWFPRRNPDYPGNRLGAFVAVTLVLFVALLGAMVLFVLTRRADSVRDSQLRADAFATVLVA